MVKRLMRGREMFNESACSVGGSLVGLASPWPPSLTAKANRSPGAKVRVISLNCAKLWRNYA